MKDESAQKTLENLFLKFLPESRIIRRKKQTTFIERLIHPTLKERNKKERGLHCDMSSLKQEAILILQTETKAENHNNV